MSENCLFCRIVRGEIPARVVAENDQCIAFHDVDPKAPLHVLIIPREHVESLDTASDAAQLGHVLLLAAEIARREGVAAKGYRTVLNTNAEAGQTVFHLHLHLLAGRKLSWPPG